MNPVRAGSTTTAFPLWPRPFRPGAKVALVAPAGPLDPDRINLSEERCRSLGLEPLVFPSARLRSGFLAGPDEERLRDLQAAFDDPEVDGVWALRGGYGTMRIVDRLDLRRQLRDPIPFVGFSDNTTLHVRHHALGVVSFHGPHPGGDFPPESEAAFRRVLFSPSPAGPLPAGPDDPAPRTLVPGSARGRLFGGNLAVLAALCGGPDALDARGRILFLEDVGEPAYRVDRMLTQLARAGVLDGVSGLAFGRFTDCPDGESGAVAEVLRETAERVGVPAVADLPFGHVAHNCTLPVGGSALLDADSGALILEAP
jgi:muramoyltetrapeptide carboxypeptidase